MHHSFYHPERKRVQINCSEPELTDQSSKKMCDINNIITQYTKTGILPHVSKAVGRFIDNTQVLPLEEAHAIITHAKELFYQLPAQVRKMMDNDPTQLNDFLNNPDNRDLLIKHKLLEPKKAPEGNPSKPSTAESVKTASTAVKKAVKAEGERLPAEKA